jgi:alpha-mannosidase
MDMNWLWTYSETMQMCNDNLRQVVAFMDEFPDYTMLQSQAMSSILWNGRSSIWAGKRIC